MQVKRMLDGHRFAVQFGEYMIFTSNVEFFQNSTFDLLIIYNAEVLILEKDITIDKDEVEQKIEFNFDIQRLRDEEIDGKLEIFYRIIYKGSDIASKIDSMIVVRTERGRR